jgi:hypothetical protein
MKEQTEKRPLEGFFVPWLPGVEPSQIKKGETKGNNVITPRKGIKVDWITDELHGNDILPFRNFFFSVFTQFFLFLTLHPKKFWNTGAFDKCGNTRAE